MSDWAFIEHVTNQLQRPRPGDARHPTLWPSEASATYLNENGETVVVGKCRRAMFFRYLTDCYKFYPRYKIWRPLVEQLQTESKPVDKYMLYIWAAGNLYEDFLINQAKCSGIFVDEQVPIYVRSHNISGKKDVEVLNPITGKLSIIEAKSVYGFGGNVVLGTPAARKRGQMGEPRESNLMQIALYDWWSASMDPAYEESRLVYGARDTGRYAEYLVRTVKEEDTIYIEYKPWHPYMGEWVRSPITINSILDEYASTQQAVDGGRIPPRDYDIKWSDVRTSLAYLRGELGKTDADKYEKLAVRKEENEWISQFLAIESDSDLIIEAYSNSDKFLMPVVKLLLQYADDTSERAEGKSEKIRVKLVKALRAVKHKKDLAPLEKSDWQCNYCKYAPICYDKERNPQDLK